MTLTLEEQQRLLRLARRCLEARVRRDIPPPVERGGGLDAPMGAFVSVHHHGNLRGCLGRLETDRPIAENVAHLAAVVSDSDPRFAPIAPHELAGVELEISALTPEQEIHEIGAIEVGRHGLIIEQGHRRGLLLPQVAVEYGWSRDTFLDHTCVKAGLPAHAWRTGARIFIFEAQVFSETHK